MPGSPSMATLLESISEAFVALDRDWCYTYVNTKAGQLLQRQPDDLLGKHIWAEFPDSVGQPFYHACHRALADQVAIEIEECHPPSDRWFENRICPTPDGVSIFFHDIAARKRAEALANGQYQILEMIAAGAPLDKTLDTLLHLIEQQSPDMLCSILLLAEDGIHVQVGAAPSLPAAYNQAVAGQPIGPRAGSCGAAAYFRETVIVEDIAADPRWDDYRDVALQHGLRACWSTPIFDAAQRVLGSFAIYNRQPCGPTAVHQRLVEIATYIAAVAISRARDEAALRTSYSLLEATHAIAKLGGWELDLATRSLTWTAEIYHMHETSPEEFKPTIDEGIKYFLPESQKIISAAMQAAIEHGQGYDLELEKFTLKGRKFDVRTTCMVTLHDGKPVKLTGIMQDITERKQIEQVLRTSEALKGAILGASLDCIITMNHEGNIVEFNPAAERTFGFTRAEVIGKSMDALIIPPSLREQHRRGLARYLATGDGPILGKRFEMQALRADGTEFPIELAVARVSQAEFPLFTGFVRDITERKQAETKLTASENRLRNIIDNEPECVKLLAADGALLEMNAAGLRMLEADSFEQVKGHSVSRIVAEEDRAAFEALTKKIFAGESGNLEFQIIGLKGTQRWLETHASPMRDASGKITALLGITRDITERKKFDSTREALEAQLREAQKMEALGTLAGGIAHDFNNILGAIMGNIALAREELGESHAASAHLHEIAKAGQRATSLVEQILAFSRKQTQELTIQPLQPLLAEAVGLLRATIPTSVRIETEITKAPIYARANATQISQVLINLITNAWHALPDGKGLISLALDEVELDGLPLLNTEDLPPGRYVRIRVRDNGYGMDPATQTRIFEPFFTTKPVGTATGLGLAVVHGLVTAHHGTITLTSALGEGSLFEVLLPATVAPVSILTTKTAALPVLNGEGRHVLYLDDDSAMVLLVTRLLNKRGFKVSGFEVAADAITAVRAAPDSFDLVVTDFNMPKASGLDVARTIAEIKPALPVVIISGYITDSLRSSARQAGVHHLVQKANSVEELTEALSKIIALEDV